MNKEVLKLFSFNYKDQKRKLNDNISISEQ